jgi:hypothetical protein
MKIEIDFSGLMCGIRRWPEGSDFPADNKSRHKVAMLGAAGGNLIDPTDPTKGTVPIHYPRLTLPLSAVMETTIDPIETIETRAAQLGVWDLSGQLVTLEGVGDDGVRFSDDNRPRGFNSKHVGNGPSFLEDWNDIAWIVEIDRVFNRRVELAVNPDRPDPALVSFAMTLNAGELRTLKPRSNYDADSTFAFDPSLNDEYWQSFSDRLRVTANAATPTLVLTPLAGGPARKIPMKRDAQVCVSSLSRSLTGGDGEDPDRLTHFTGLYRFFSGLNTSPVPVRKTAPKAAGGEQTVEPFFCLPAFHNIDF